MTTAVANRLRYLPSNMEDTYAVQIHVCADLSVILSAPYRYLEPKYLDIQETLVQLESATLSPHLKYKVSYDSRTNMICWYPDESGFTVSQIVAVRHHIIDAGVIYNDSA